MSGKVDKFGAPGTFDMATKFGAPGTFDMATVAD
jgi:hypothetical protein